MPGRKKKILCNLLANCARSAHRTVRMPVMLSLCIFDLCHVKAMMIVESLVFCSNDCLNKIIRHLAPAYIRMGKANRLTGKYMIDSAKEHHRCDRRIDKAQ